MFVLVTLLPPFFCADSQSTYDVVGSWYKKAEVAARICLLLLGAYMVYMLFALTIGIASSPPCDEEAIPLETCGKFKTGFDLVLLGVAFNIVATLGSTCSGWDFYGLECSET